MSIQITLTLEDPPTIAVGNVHVADWGFVRRFPYRHHLNEYFKNKKIDGKLITANNTIAIKNVDTPVNINNKVFVYLRHRILSMLDYTQVFVFNCPIPIVSDYATTKTNAEEDVEVIVLDYNRLIGLSAEEQELFFKRYIGQYLGIDKYTEETIKDDGIIDDEDIVLSLLPMDRTSSSILG